MDRVSWLRNFFRSPPGVIGLVVFALLLFCAFFGGLIAPHPPNQPDLVNRLAPPMWVDGGLSSYPLGTDQLGRDIFSRIISGTRLAMVVGFGSVALALVIGVTLGLLSVFGARWLEPVIMRVTDAIMAVPNILLYLTVLTVFGPSLPLLITVLGLINWTVFARIVRAESLRVRTSEYVEASFASGSGAVRTLVKHVLPNIMAPIIVVFTLNTATIILIEASLSFLGFGVQAPAITWGRMLSDGRDFVATAWWLATFPGAAITLLVLSLIFIGDSLRDALDPKTS